MEHIYDLIILGAGPAGLTAGLYAGRSRLDTLILEKGVDGGQIAITAELENYPASLPGDSGPTLIARLSEQVAHFGAQRVTATVTAVSLAGDVKTVTCGDRTYRARAVILASGAYPRPIGCPREAEFAGRGISYCATCDANFFTGLEVYVVGGGDSAVEEALYLTKFARSVTIIHRRDALRAAKTIQEKAFANPKIHVVWDSVVTDLSGNGVLNGMTLKNVKTGALTQIEADPGDGVFGLFVFIGLSPFSRLFEGQIHMKDGYILTDETMRTSLPGVFAAGDIRVKSLRQVVTATADGAIAATEAERYLDGL